MADFIIVVVVLAMVGAAVRYLIKQKKSGAKCIGCPSGCNCSQSKNGSGCNCGCENQK